jgi:hypothetical protein
MADVISIHWSRWIFASLTNHFSDHAQSTNFFVEGQNRDPSITDYAEFRMDGPYFNEINSSYWKIDVIAAIIVNIIQNDADIHKLDRIIGIYLAAFTPNIDVFKYGDSEIDDQSLLGCLKLATNTGERIRVDKFGQVRAATRVAQASIEAHYELNL